MEDVGSGLVCAAVDPESIVGSGAKRWKLSLDHLLERRSTLPQTLQILSVVWGLQRGRYQAAMSEIHVSHPEQRTVIAPPSMRLGTSST